MSGSGGAKVGDKNTAPTTTAAEDAIPAGQRRINLIWEVTQAAMALTVTAVTLFVTAKMAIVEKSQAAYLILSNTFFLVTAVYFQRTNHSRIGGVKSGDEGR